MTDLDDASLLQVELRARHATQALLRRLFPMQEYPAKDAAGVLRHGYGRPIDQRPMTVRAAAFVLAEQVIHAQNILRARVFELIATHPEVEPKLPPLYAIGDILGAERLRDWTALWDAMRRGAWPAVGIELMTAQWDRYVGASEDKRRAVFELILKISTPGPLQ